MKRDESGSSSRGGRRDSRKRGDQKGRRQLPPDQTHDEARYIKELKEKETLLDVMLSDARIVRGTITYFDRDMIKLAPTSGPTIFVRKTDIRTIAEVDTPTDH